MNTPITFQLFAKAPLPGRVKTRLVPALSPSDAALLHVRLVERTAAAVSAACRNLPGAHGELWGAPDCSDLALQSIARRHALRPMTQRGGDLGARMQAALSTAMPGRAILVGSDWPLVDADALAEAAAALLATPVAFVPADDGGYTLVGCRDRVPPCFDGIAWSTSRVMAETRRLLAAAGIRWSELDPAWDVDTPADLERLAADPRCTALLEGLARARSDVEIDRQTL